MGYTIIEDLKTFLVANFVHTNVAGLSADPNIKLGGDDDPTSFSSNGDILLTDEIFLRQDIQGNYRTQSWQIIGYVLYPSSDSVIIKLILTEIDRILKVNNANISRTKIYELQPRWDSNYGTGIVEFNILATTLPEVLV